MIFFYNNTFTATSLFKVDRLILIKDQKTQAIITRCWKVLPLLSQIKPEQVMGPCQPGPVFIIIDCPTVDYIPSLMSNEQLSRHHEGGSCATPVVIVHLTPMSVFQNGEYEMWRNRWELSSVLEIIFLLNRACWGLYGSLETWKGRESHGKSLWVIESHWKWCSLWKKFLQKHSFSE